MRNLLAYVTFNFLLILVSYCTINQIHKICINYFNIDSDILEDDYYMPSLQEISIINNKTYIEKSLRTYSFPNHPKFLLPYQIEYHINNYLSFLNKTSNNEVKQYMVYIPTQHGIGNKLDGLVTSFFISLITQRHLAICKWPEFSKLFYFTLNVDVLSDDSPMCNMNPYTLLTSDLKYIDTYSVYKDLFFSTNNTIVLNTNVDITMYNYFRPYLNKFFEMFGFSDSPYSYDYFSFMFKHYIYHHILLPSPLIRDKVDDVYSKWNNNVYIGIHIRTSDILTGLGNISHIYSRNSSIDKMIDHAINLTNISPYPVKWFITTDDMKLKAKLYSFYPDYIIVYNSTISHTGYSSLKHINEGLIDALTELYLLGRCNYVIGSLYSTYSMNAIALAGVVPTIIR